MAVPEQAKAVLTPQDVQRFWGKVDVRGPDDCWPWTASCQSGGYGQFWVGSAGYCVGSHRIVATLTHGPMSREEPEALHSCDNPPCCNPAHIRWGTSADNGADMVTRHRQIIGERQWSARLTDAAVRDMRTMYAAGVGTPTLGRRFGVHQGTAHSVVTHKTWRHVT